MSSDIILFGGIMVATLRDALDVCGIVARGASLRRIEQEYLTLVGILATTAMEHRDRCPAARGYGQRAGHPST